MQSSDFFAEQQRWKEQRYAQAYEMDLSTIPLSNEDALMNELDFSLNSSAMADQELDHDKIMEEADTVAQLEQMELEAMMELADQDPMVQDQTAQTPRRKSDSPNYDDDTYDALFVEFISTEGTGDLDMDLTNG
jgi:hypothetical protein